MAKKNECYLCGGKLHGGYCPDCGLDNTKIQRKHYHLNESYAVESMNGDTRRVSKKCKVKTKQDNRNESSFHTEKSKKKDISQKGIPSSGKVKIAVTAFGLAAVVSGLIGSYAADNRQIFISQGEYESEPEIVYNDPYAYVEKELVETGEHYEAELGPGEYLIGVHIPEGRYTAELLEGRGGISVDDIENAIYLWQYFGTDEEYDEVESKEDIRLYTGAHLEISDAVLLRLTTENGQTEEMDFVDNPLTESVMLKKNKTMTVGEELASGVYDFNTMFGWTILRCRVPDDSYEEGYYEKSYWLGGEEWDHVYRNLYLKDGIEITAEENSLELTPSKVIGSEDYEVYYPYY